MENIVEMYWRLRSQSASNGDVIAKTIAVAAHEQPAAFFGMAFNGITLSLELIDHYCVLWKNLTTTTGPSLEEAKEQNGQRVILIQKMCFIEIMSSFEFCAKHIVSKNPSLFGTFKGRIYLEKIMTSSNELGLMDDATLHLWQGLIRLRNSLVHNNGISSETAQYFYPSVVLTVQDCSMIRGNLRQYGALTEWLLDAAQQWIESATPSSH